jgi:flagellar hook-associated protein 2
MEVFIMDYSLLGLSSSGTSTLNNDLIEKIKAAETKAKIDPLQKKIDNIISTDENNIGELLKFDKIKTKLSELKDSLKMFDLYNQDNVFNNNKITTKGLSGVFEAISNLSSIKEGDVSINVTSLAQKNVIQSNHITNKDEVIQTNSGSFDIVLNNLKKNNGLPLTYNVGNKTYNQLVEEINKDGFIDASLEEVDLGVFRMVLKSKSSGELNSFSISNVSNSIIENNSSIIGLTTSENNVLKAKDLNVVVDGVSIISKENKINIETLGVSFNANDLGESSISIKNNKLENISKVLSDFKDKYNSLIEEVNSDIYSDKSIMNDKSGIKTILSDIKNSLFQGYQNESELSLFSLGVGFTKEGFIEIDEIELNKVISNASKVGNEDLLKSIETLFLGTAESEGFGTSLKSKIDNMFFANGMVDLIDSGIEKNKKTLIETMKKEQEKLDKKYQDMANQFVEYNSIITKMQSGFAGMKAMMESEMS